MFRILDFLCQRTSHADYGTILMYITSYLCAANVIFIYGWAKSHGVDTAWLFFSPLPSFFGVEHLYRHFRHKYLRKHHLPGPYGNGTIDPEIYH